MNVKLNHTLRELLNELRPYPCLETWVDGRLGHEPRFVVRTGVSKPCYYFGYNIPYELALEKALNRFRVEALKLLALKLIDELDESGA